MEGEFLLEYAGKLLLADEGESLGDKYAAENKGCYLYYFNHQNKQYWYVILINFSFVDL